MKKISCLSLLLLLGGSMQAQEYRGLLQLETLILPASTTEIGSKAFAGCRSLTSVTCANAEAPVCAADAFSAPTVGKGGVATLTAGSNAYATADGWRFFAVINTVDNSGNLSQSSISNTGSNWAIPLSTGCSFVLNGAGMVTGNCYTVHFSDATGSLLSDVDATLISIPEGTKRVITANVAATGLTAGSYVLQAGDVSVRLEIRTSVK